MTPVAPSSTATNSPAEARRGQRRRWTEQQKSELLAAFAVSGLTAAEFCRRSGVSPSAISAWSRRRRAIPAPSVAPGFAEVRLAGAATDALVIHLGADITISVPRGTDAIWVGHLLRAARMS
jgi:transcriptional regulator with XRE-family HTH domain